ncbi:hypothetical protein HDU96_001128 [Phlyctochytrium bullatum]|nr:hypothetical protein HDU96_001128 [Phlyctochytrium bullatum]
MYQSKCAVLQILWNRILTIKAWTDVYEDMGEAVYEDHVAWLPANHPYLHCVQTNVPIKICETGWNIFLPDRLDSKRKADTPGQDDATPASLTTRRGAPHDSGVPRL